MVLLMLKTIAFTLSFLLSNFAFAGTKDCVAQNISNAGEKTFVLYNSLINLSVGAFPKTETAFRVAWHIVTFEAQGACRHTYPTTLTEVKKINDNEFAIAITAGKFIVGVKQVGNSHTFYTSKLTGNYAGQPFLLVNYKDNRLEFIRITGRESEAADIRLYNFVFTPDQNHKFLVTSDDLTNFKSLKTIFNNNVPRTILDIPVGVIGTGVDYNHPRLALQLAYRQDIEDDVQQLEILSHKLSFHVYDSLQTYLDDQRRFDRMQENVGFPRWMDPAMNSVRPFDRTVTDRFNPFADFHETLITSRIVINAPNVKLFSVRRRMGKNNETLNVTDIIRRFANEGVRVVNLSFGSTCGLIPSEERLWDQTFARYPNIIFVAAAGNTGENVDITPACPSFYSTKYKNVISVTAADFNGLSQYYGKYVNYGTNVDLAAIADNLEVFIPLRYGNTTFYEASGASSIATAEVTRIIVEAINEGFVIDAQKVKDQLIQSSYKIPSLIDKVKAEGLVDQQKFRELLVERTKNASNAQ